MGTKRRPRRGRRRAPPIVREDLGGHAFDLVLDAVTSGDARDAGFEYERRVRSAGLVKTPANGVAHNYVTIGSRPVGWVLAAIKRVTGGTCSRGRELFCSVPRGKRRTSPSWRASATATLRRREEQARAGDRGDAAAHERGRRGGVSEAPLEKGQGKIVVEVT